MRKFAALLFLSVLMIPAFGQEATTTTTTKRTGRPDIPGTFVLELGVNRASGAPSNFKTGFWGSRTLNVYYQYEMRILKSNFSFVPGVGFSLERYKFTNKYTLDYNGSTLLMVSPAQAGRDGTKKSQLITNYFEVPVEICFRSNPEDPARSFKASVGGRVGYLFDSFTKIKYSENGEVKKLKDKQDFNLTKFRYGAYVKVGVGNFSVFGYYNMTNLFKTGKGPTQDSKVTDFNTMTIGISLASF
ncbi:MAG TPA: outer membrane beta-barrel protein [Ohtaekwangia sp.]